MCINNLYFTGKANQPSLKKTLPTKTFSFKKTKQLYLSNNIYFDIYQDNVYYNNIENQIIKYKNLEKSKLLTAEHIVPQSYIKLYNNAKFDMHNIYLTTSYINSHRNNYKYNDESKFLNNIDNNLLYYNHNINYKNNKLQTFIPIRSSRGIIARTIAYMKIIYSELNIENIINIETLIKWNYEYPPSKLEKQKNELIYQMQGNYNEFIINSDLVNSIFKNN